MVDRGVPLWAARVVSPHQSQGVASALQILSHADIDVVPAVKIVQQLVVIRRVGALRRPVVGLWAVRTVRIEQPRRVVDHKIGVSIVRLIPEAVGVEAVMYQPPLRGVVRDTGEVPEAIVDLHVDLKRDGFVTGGGKLIRRHRLPARHLVGRGYFGVPRTGRVFDSRLVRIRHVPLPRVPALPPCNTSRHANCPRNRKTDSNPRHDPAPLPLYTGQLARRFAHKRLDRSELGPSALMQERKHANGNRSCLISDSTGSGRMQPAAPPATDLSIVRIIPRHPRFSKGNFRLPYVSHA